MKERSIALGFKEGTNKQSVAELALMHILIALRKHHQAKMIFLIKYGVRKKAMSYMEKLLESLVLEILAKA
jgi:phosphoglycerate dehydrogenase-like enzyme